MPARIDDELPLLEDTGCDRDRASAHAQHRGQECVGELQVLSTRTIVGHQEPARQPL